MLKFPLIATLLAVGLSLFSTSCTVTAPAAGATGKGPAAKPVFASAGAPLLASAAVSGAGAASSAATPAPSSAAPSIGPAAIGPITPTADKVGSIALLVAMAVFFGAAGLYQHGKSAGSHE